jgi:hypothetical protein
MRSVIDLPGRVMKYTIAQCLLNTVFLAAAITGFGSFHGLLHLGDFFEQSILLGLLVLIEEILWSALLTLSILCLLKTR